MKRDIRLFGSFAAALAVSGLQFLSAVLPKTLTPLVMQVEGGKK
jgi:hypothetical protein